MQLELELSRVRSWQLSEELREYIEMAVAAENWIDSSGVGSWQMMGESRQFS
jgi:hypothetical protein